MLRLVRGPVPSHGTNQTCQFQIMVLLLLTEQFKLIQNQERLEATVETSEYPLQNMTLAEITQ